MEIGKRIRNFELDGVRVRDINKNTDERGFFAEIARNDWVELFGENWLSQANLSYSYPGIIRAWHRHRRGQTDFFTVLHGAIKIVVYDDNKGSETYGKIVEIILSEEKLQIVSVPGHYWHGTKTIGDKPSLTIYFVNNLYDYNNPDEERLVWNDSFITDPRTNQIFDWNRPPHK